MPPPRCCGGAYHALFEHAAAEKLCGRDAEQLAVAGGMGGLGARQESSEGDVAGAALVADAAALEVAHGGGAVADGPVDVAVGFAAADADDHEVVSFCRSETESQYSHDDGRIPVRQDSCAARLGDDRHDPAVM